MILSFINNIFPYVFFNKSKIIIIKKPEKYVSLPPHITDEFQFYYLHDQNLHLKPFTNYLQVRGGKKSTEVICFALKWRLS